MALNRGKVTIAEATCTLRDQGTSESKLPGATVHVCNLYGTHTVPLLHHSQEPSNHLTVRDSRFQPGWTNSLDMNNGPQRAS